MKEQILEKLMTYLQNTEVFLSEQTPQVINELITYELYMSYAKIGTFIGILILSAIILFYLIKKEIHEEVIGGVLCISIVLATLFGVLSVGAVNDIIKIKVAPKVFVLDKLRDK
jgi:UDP-N-acetylmuramyl pentapeptide phosphotransferase/UDP-N-acetylglucosamine-1-phosphate transferase